MSRPATSRLKFNPPLGRMPTLQFILPGELAVDPTYQRSIEAGESQTLIRRIAQFWNWDLCQPLVVSRRDDGALYVIDGQHRLEAAKLRGDIAQLPCVIVAYASAADEAASFVHLNQQRRPLIALDLFRAAIASEDPEALAVRDEIAKAGLSLAPHMTAAAWKVGMIGNVGGLLRVARQYGMARLGTSLRAMALGFEGQVLRYAGTVFPGIAAVVGEQCDNLDFDRLVATLRQHSQSGWRSEVALHHAATPDEGMTQSAKSVIRSAYAGYRPPVHDPGDTMPRAQSASVVIPAAYQPESDGRRWCEQCDRRVTDLFASNCRSQFCSLKVRA